MSAYWSPWLLHIHCTVEIFNNLGQLSVHFFNPFRLDEPTQRPLCDHQHIAKFRNADCLPKRPRLT